MIPIGDDRESGGGTPLVTWALVALNVLAFFFQLAQPSGALESFIQSWGVVPREYAAARDLPPTIPLPFWTTLFTSMFLHGGFLHLGGNMLYLWIFGDNIERRIGSARFFAFYLLCGLAAGIGHILFSLSSDVPTIGASGAISGVLGGYLVLFPRNRVRVLTRGGVAAVPAMVVLGIWILIQVVSQMSAGLASSGGGVAYMAHIAGFVAGIATIKLFASGPRRCPAHA
ncbi:MAG: rhomboid family intramembrane serine protease [Vicinamibacteria bacterium]